MTVRIVPRTAESWAEQTRRVLTRDLLVRARHGPPGEGRALQFRAVHLNLPLIGEVAEDLGLTPRERAAVEHAALDGLVEAVRLYDPWDESDFACFAAPFVRAQMLAHLPVGRTPGRPGVRLVVRRAAQAMAGYHA
jgi:DNA-directed RNA polymerase specialized sigma subunit